MKRSEVRRGRIKDAPDSPPELCTGEEVDEEVAGVVRETDFLSDLPHQVVLEERLPCGIFFDLVVLQGEVSFRVEGGDGVEDGGRKCGCYDVEGDG